MLLALCWLLLTLGLSSETKAQPAIVGPANAIICTTVFQSSFTTTSAFTLVTGQTNKGIYICGWSMSTTNTASQTTFQLSYMTGPCNGGGTSTFITPVHGVQSTAPYVDHIDYAFTSAPNTGLTATPNNVCLLTGGTGNNIAVMLYYSQF